MRVLGIDTSAYANSVGVVSDGKALADFTFEARSDSLQKIIAHIDSALKSAGLTLDNVEGFGVGLGPGSWTGIRIGVTVGKIFAYSRRKQVAGVPTLAALAYGARNTPTVICAIISAGTKDTIYAAFYQTQNGSTSQINEYYIGDVPGLARVIKEPVVLVSLRARDYASIINETPNFAGIITEIIEATPKGSAVAQLAAARLNRGESDDVLSLAPLYLKESTVKAFQGGYLSRLKSR